MLPYLTASLHILSAKSAYLYLQMISNLLQTHPDVRTKFQGGYVAWRSDRYWGGTVYRSHHRTGSDEDASKQVAGWPANTLQF